MKKFGLGILLTVFILVSLTGCKKDKNKITVREGRYVSVDGESYITVTDYKNGKSDEFEEVTGYCDIQFCNVDMSTFIDFYLANNTGSYVAVNMGGKATEKELDEIRKMLLERVDFKAQFEDNKAHFFVFKDSYGDYGMASKVEGSGFDQGYETYVSLLFLPEENIIAVDGVKYILSE